MQYPIILRTLAHLKLSSKSADVRRSAEQLTECITKMEFLVPLLMWKKILHAIYAVSKQLQTKSANLSVSVALLGETVTFISTLRNDFDNICQSAEDMARKWGAEASFKDTRTRTRKRFFYELSNDTRLESPRDRFRVHIFLPVVDTCLGQLKTRFESLRGIVDLFSFLFPQQLMELSEADLENQVTKFTTVYNADVAPDLLRQILAIRVCAESFIIKAENPQDRPEFHHETGTEHVFSRCGNLLLPLSHPASDNS